MLMRFSLFATAVAAQESVQQHEDTGISFDSAHELALKATSLAESLPVDVVVGVSSRRLPAKKAAQSAVTKSKGVSKERSVKKVIVPAPEMFRIGDRCEVKPNKSCQCHKNNNQTWKGKGTMTVVKVDGNKITAKRENNQATHQFLAQDLQIAVVNLNCQKGPQGNKCRQKLRENLLSSARGRARSALKKVVTVDVPKTRVPVPKMVNLHCEKGTQGRNCRDILVALLEHENPLSSSPLFLLSSSPVANSYAKLLREHQRPVAKLLREHRKNATKGRSLAESLEDPNEVEADEEGEDDAEDEQDEEEVEGSLEKQAEHMVDCHRSKLSGEQVVMV